MKSKKPFVDVGPADGVKPVTESIWWVGRGPWGGLQALSCRGDCNIYLLRGRKFDVLIDSGGTADVRRLERNVRLCGSEPSRIRQIWLTHSHGDHSAGAWAWLRRHRRTTCHLSSVGVQFFRRGDLRLAGRTRSPDPDFRPPRGLVPVRAGDVLRCPPHELKAVALPGHTPDCLGFRGTIDGLDVMFTGDAIIGDQGPVRGNVGWLDVLWLSSAREYERTLIRAAGDPPELFLPGHGVGQYGPSARRSIRHCLQRIRWLLAIPHAGTMFPFIGR